MRTSGLDTFIPFSVILQHTDKTSLEGQREIHGDKTRGGLKEEKKKKVEPGLEKLRSERMCEV